MSFKITLQEPAPYQPKKPLYAEPQTYTLAPGCQWSLQLVLLRTCSVGDLVIEADHAHALVITRLLFGGIQLLSTLPGTLFAPATPPTLTGLLRKGETLALTLENQHSASQPVKVWLDGKPPPNSPIPVLEELQEHFPGLAVDLEASDSGEAWAISLTLEGYEVEVFWRKTATTERMGISAAAPGRFVGYGDLHDEHYDAFVDGWKRVMQLLHTRAYTQGASDE